MILPMVPRPMMRQVFFSTSKTFLASRIFQLPFRCSTSDSTMFLDRASISVTACSATLRLLAPGVMTTGMPSFVADSTSPLS